MTQCHVSVVDIDDDHAEWTGDSRYARPFNVLDLICGAYEDEDDTLDLDLGPDDDDEDDDMEDDDEDE